MHVDISSLKILLKTLFHHFHLIPLKLHHSISFTSTSLFHIFHDFTINGLERVVNLVRNRLYHHEPIFDNGFNHMVDLSLLVTHFPVWISCTIFSFLHLAHILFLGLILILIWNRLLAADSVIKLIAGRPECLCKKKIDTFKRVLSPERVSFLIALKYVLKVFIQISKLFIIHTTHYPDILFLFLGNYLIYFLFSLSLLL